MVGQLLVRGLDDGVIHTLKRRATMAGRSVEAEHRLILEQVLGKEAESFAERAARLREASPRHGTDSAELIRADRDRDQVGAL